MTETSGLWTTSGTPSGHQVASYTQALASTMLEIVSACSGFEGVAPSYLNELECTDGGANTVDVDTGGAIVDGKWYKNDAVENVNIPSAVGGGNTRIDRIVLRATWASFTVEITRIAGTDAASPTAPSITQTSGTTYDIQLCQVLVDTSGNVTVTDERVWGNPTVKYIKGINADGQATYSSRVTGDSNYRFAVESDGRLYWGNGTDTADTHLYRSAADTLRTPDSLVIDSDLTVTGGLTFAAGAIARADLEADIIDGTKLADDSVNSEHYAAGSIDLEHMSANSIDSDQYVDGSIDTVHLANDAVDDTKVGNRVPQFYRRQGGSSTIWTTAGTTDYTPTTVRMQAGAVDIVVNTESPPGTWSGTTTITFDTAFSYAPLVFVSANSSVGFTYLNTGTISTTQAALIAVRAASGTVKVFWLAIGPE